MFYGSGDIRKLEGIAYCLRCLRRGRCCSVEGKSEVQQGSKIEMRSVWELGTSPIRAPIVLACMSRDEGSIFSSVKMNFWDPSYYENMKIEGSRSVLS